MAIISIELPDHLVETFCGWFSNSGEQDLMEAHADGVWNEKTQQWDPVTTYISVEGYGVNEPIRIIEYDNNTHEKVS